MIRCINCERPYPDAQTPYRCPVCGDVYDFSNQVTFDRDQVDRTLPGIWQYQHTFALNENVPMVSLGEGNTPLVWSEAFGHEIAFKLEFLNPTGSFKDRGVVPLISFLSSRGITAIVEDSSGNAGASLAAYSAAVGIQAKIFVPDYASGPKCAQIKAYGADIVRVQGTRSKTSEAVMQAAANGEIYASHVYMPHDVQGYATIAYELFEQIGAAPGTVICPAGQGSLLLGIGRGFEALKRSKLIEQIPVLVGVQAAACAPLLAFYNGGETAFNHVYEGDTIAEGVRSRNPIRRETITAMLRQTQGIFVSVDEEYILPGRDQLAFRGLFVEPTSAIVWNGLSQVLNQVPEPIVVILTGSGLKSAL